MWNGSYRRYLDNNLQTIFQQKQSTSAEINLALTALLKEAGFQAHPALISTRRHGNVVKVYPLLSQFNHVITWVSINNQDYLLDATDPLRPFDLLDEEDLNENALILDHANTRWIEVKPAGTTKSTLMATVDLSNLHNPLVALESRLEGYTAYNQRKKWNEGMDSQLLLNQLGVHSPVHHLDNMEVADPKNIINHFSCKVSFTLPELVEINNDLVYLKPLLTENNNPFKSLARSYPVDFGYPNSEYSTVLIKIPDGYIAEELPEGLHLKLPRDYGYFLYQIDYKGKDLQLVIRFNMQKTIIPTHDYNVLREFYGLIIAKTNEMIVLKKI
ncbi:hypothetical protein BH23BAC1_BH23BAC1_23110 [soil metagenome]